MRKGNTAMKKILCMFVLCLLLSVAAQAETLSIGDESINYTVPQGYMAGDKEPYLGMRRFVTDASPKNMQILALYVDEESHKKLMDSQGQPLERYFIVSTARQLEHKSLKVKDFMEVKKGIVKAQERLKTTLRARINRLLGQASDGSMSVGDIETLGVFDSSDTSFSFMAVMDQVHHENGRRQADKQAVVSSYLLAQGKLVIVNQYQLLDPARNMTEQLNAAKEHARRVLRELNIKEGVSWKAYLDAFPVKVLVGALAGGLIGGLIGWLVRRRKKQAVA